MSNIDYECSFKSLEYPYLEDLLALNEFSKEELLHHAYNLGVLSLVPGGGRARANTVTFDMPYMEALLGKRSELPDIWNADRINEINTQPAVIEQIVPAVTRFYHTALNICRGAW